MPESCTCGAVLPEDARFCHKCGKPQREEDVAAEREREAVRAVAEAVSSLPPPIPLPQPISMRDRTAVSTGLMASGATLLLSAVLGPLAPVVGGFLAVFLYQRRTRQPITTLNGIRIGWIAGIFFFTITSVFLAVIALALTQPEMAQRVREELGKSALSTADAERFFEMLRSVSGIASILLVVFVSTTLMMSLGGFVATLLVRRGTPNQPNS